MYTTVIKQQRNCVLSNVNTVSLRNPAIDLAPNMPDIQWVFNKYLTDRGMHKTFLEIGLLWHNGKGELEFTPHYQKQRLYIYNLKQ